MGSFPNPEYYGSITFPMSIPKSDHLPWFAIYVKTRHEKQVAFALEGRGYEAFLPTRVKRHAYNRTFHLPLFPGYVFSRIEPSNTLPIVTTPGVVSIVGNGRSPEPISEPEIEGLKTIVKAGLRPIPWRYLSPGQEILVESGPLRGVKGVLVDARNETWVVLSINLLRRSVAVKVGRDSLYLSTRPILAT